MASFRCSTSSHKAPFSLEGTRNNRGSGQHLEQVEEEEEIWKRCGRARRQELLQKYVLSEERTIHIDLKSPIEGYYEIAERAYNEFQTTFDGKTNERDLDDLFIMGSRLTKFLAKEIPSHPQYFSRRRSLSKLRSNSQSNLAEISTMMKKLVDEIDQDEYNRFVLDDLTSGFSCMGSKNESHNGGVVESGIDGRGGGADKEGWGSQMKSTLESVFEAVSFDKYETAEENWNAFALDSDSNWACFPNEPTPSLHNGGNNDRALKIVDAIPEQDKTTKKKSKPHSPNMVTRFDDFNKDNGGGSWWEKGGASSCELTQGTDDISDFYLEIDHSKGRGEDFSMLTEDHGRSSLKKCLFTSCFNSLTK